MSDQNRRAWQSGSKRFDNHKNSKISGEKMVENLAIFIFGAPLNKQDEIEAPKTLPLEKAALSESELIDLRTSNVFTLRVNDDFKAALNAIKGDLVAFRFTAVECMRHIALHVVLTPIERRFAIATGVNKNNEGLKKSSTTFGFNQFTKLKLEEALQELNAYSKQVNLNFKFDVTGLLTQAVYDFSKLTREEKFEAVKTVKATYGDMLNFLTPAQAEAAKLLL